MRLLKRCRMNRLFQLNVSTEGNEQLVPISSVSLDIWLYFIII
jgi:hypothetical protein